MTLLGPSAPGMAFMMKKKKYKFSVELQLEELVEVPFLSAVLFAKIRLLDGGSFQACSNREEVRNHAVKWGQTFEIICKMSANASTGVLDPCTLRISVRKEVKGGRSYQKLGFIDLNLAEYAGSGLIARRCLLEGYDARHRQDNSMLRLAIKMHMLSGDILFKVPSSNVNSKQITSQQDDELCINGNIGSSGGGGGGGGGVSNNVQQTPKLLQTSGSRPQDRVTTATAISSERQIPPGGVMSITTSVTSSSSSSFVTAATTQHQIPISSIMQSSTSASTRDDASIASGSSGFGSLTKNKKSDTLHTNEMMDSVVSSVASATTTAAATTTSTSMYHQLLSSSSSSTCGVTDSGDKSDTFEQNVLPSIQQPQINYPSNMELGHSRNSSNTSQMSKGSGYSSFSHSQHSRQSSEGDSGHQRWHPPSFQKSKPISKTLLYPLTEKQKSALKLKMPTSPCSDNEIFYTPNSSVSQDDDNKTDSGMDEYNNTNIINNRKHHNSNHMINDLDNNNNNNKSNGIYKITKIQSLGNIPINYKSTMIYAEDQVDSGMDEHYSSINGIGTNNNNNNDDDDHINNNNDDAFDNNTPNHSFGTIYRMKSLGNLSEIERAFGDTPKDLLLLKEEFEQKRFGLARRKSLTNLLIDAQAIDEDSPNSPNSKQYSNGDDNNNNNNINNGQSQRSSPKRDSIFHSPKTPTTISTQHLKNIKYKKNKIGDTKYIGNDDCLENNNNNNNNNNSSNNQYNLTKMKSMGTIPDVVTERIEYEPFLTPTITRKSINVFNYDNINNNNINENINNNNINENINNNNNNNSNTNDLIYDHNHNKIINSNPNQIISKSLKKQSNSIDDVYMQPAKTIVPTVLPQKITPLTKSSTFDRFTYDLNILKGPFQRGFRRSYTKTSDRNMTTTMDTAPLRQSDGYFHMAHQNNDGSKNKLLNGHHIENNNNNNKNHNNNNIPHQTILNHQQQSTTTKNARIPILQTIRSSINNVTTNDGSKSSAADRSLSGLHRRLLDGSTRQLAVIQNNSSSSSHNNESDNNNEYIISNSNNHNNGIIIYDSNTPVVTTNTSAITCINSTTSNTNTTGTNPITFPVNADQIITTTNSKMSKYSPTPPTSTFNNINNTTTSSSTTRTTTTTATTTSNISINNSCSNIMATIISTSPHNLVAPSSCLAIRRPSTNINPSSGSIVMSETGSLDRMKAAAERRKKGLDDGSGGVGPSVSGRVEGTRVNPDSLIAEILKNTKLDQLEESTESSGLKLYIDKDGNTSLSSHEVQSRMTGGVYKQVVMENPR